MAFQLTSTAFPHNGEVPRQYTCDGPDVSPPLQWTDPPPKTRSLSLICDDPDAPVGTWVHWVLFHLPETARGLAEAVPKDPTLADGSKQGTNDFRRLGYGGPCPPPGPAHRYFFKLYALDNIPELKPGATKKDLERAMQGHILAEAQFIGHYQRGR